MIDVETIEFFGKVDDVTSDVARFAQFCGKSYGVSESENALDKILVTYKRNVLIRRRNWSRRAATVASVELDG